MKAKQYCYAAIQVNVGELLHAVAELGLAPTDTVDLVILQDRTKQTYLTFENDGEIDCITGQAVDYCNDNVNLLATKTGE